MRGFTLLEALVVAAIITTLAGTLLSLNSTSRRQITLFRDRAVIIGALTRAKALAIEKFNEADACAFGVHFSAYSREIVIFKDTLAPGETLCSVGGAYKGNRVYMAGNEINEGVFSLSTGLRLFIEDGTGLQRGFTDVLFIPPDPETNSLDPLPITVSVGKGEPLDFGDTPSGAIPVESVKVEISPAGQITAR